MDLVRPVSVGPGTQLSQGLDWNLIGEEVLSICHIKWITFFYITARVGLWCLPGKAMCCSQNPLIVDEWSTTSMHTAPIKADLPWPSASWCILSPHYPCVETCFATHWKWTRQRKHILDKQLVMEKNGNIFNITWLVKLCWKTGYHPVVRHTLKNKNQVQLLMASVVQKVHMQYKTLFQKRRQTLVKMNY